MASQKDYTSFFHSELEKLNTAQKQAVETIDGPVLVLAGPGTGKTQILSARIGNILEKTDAKPHNILCLTYTDAGAIAMRERLLKFIGPIAYDVHVFTFHTFCSKVIQENLNYFGVRNLQPLSELEAVETIYQIIDDFDATNPLKRLTGEAYYDKRNLENLYDMMKKEQLSPAFIKEKVSAYLEDLKTDDEFLYKRNYKEFKKGDLNEKKFNTEKERMEKLLAASASIKDYEKILNDIKRYDFNDMILWVIDAFKNNKDMLLNYQERYHYFLIDEYQDTNGSQNEIVNLLSSYWDIPNTFVVGDDDQSIYRFQGANLKNILEYYTKNEKEIQTIVLTDNYRSSQPILDSSKALIDHNNERLVKVVEGLSKDLIAKASTLTDLPLVREYNNPIHEEASIVSEIKSLWESGEDIHDVAIIYRNHKQVENIVKLLDFENIPYNVRKKVNILEEPFILNILKIFEYLLIEDKKTDSGEYLLFELIHYPYFKISPRDIARISRACAYSSKSKSRLPWRDVIGSKEMLFKIGVENINPIISLERNLSYWMTEKHSFTIQVLFEKILTRGSILEYVMNSHEKKWYIQLITSIFNFIKEESNRTQNLSIADLLEKIKKMRDNGISIDINKVSHTEKGVNLVTAHSSKGLEYKTVYLIGSNANVWEGKRNNNRGFSLPKNISLSNAENKEEEERRLFFVAMTRAREELKISYSANTEGGKLLEKSRFVYEVLEGSDVTFIVEKVDEDALVEYSMNILLDTSENKTIELIDTELIKESLKDYKLSVTNLNKYLKCPRSFYFENILRVPNARNAIMGYGSAVHHALEIFFKEWQKNDTIPNIDALLEYFHEGMQKFHSHFTTKEYEDRIEYAKQTLPEYYDKYHQSWNKITRQEYRVNTVHHGIPITGALDKLEFNGNSVNVVDYKTGNADNGPAKLNGPSEKDPLGGDYWRQIVFYKILMDNDTINKWEMTSGEMDFVQKSKKKNDYLKVKLIVTPEDVTTVTNQMKDAYSRIMNLEFDYGCGEENCQWCNFVKNNFNSEKLTLIEEES